MVIELLLIFFPNAIFIVQQALEEGTLSRRISSSHPIGAESSLNQNEQGPCPSCLLVSS